MVNKINFIIPDFLNVEECTYLLSTFSSYKEVLKDNIEIIGFVGSFPGCVWNKCNKKENRYKLDENTLVNIKKKYNDELQVSLYIIFNNENININELDDVYSNMIIKTCNDKRNYVLCNSKSLKEYIKDQFKKINVIDYYSETNKEDVFLIVEELNDDLLEKEKDFKSKLIVIPNGDFNNKKNMYKHSLNDSVLNKINPKKYRYFNKTNSNSFYERKISKYYISFENMVRLASNGINTFMLSGLGVYNIAMYENIIDYLYKDEYKVDARIIAYNRLIQYKEQECNAIFNYRL